MDEELTNSNDTGTPLGLAFYIDSLIQPTLRRLEVTSLEELAALDLSEVSKQNGIGSKKLEKLGRLILKARAQVQSVSVSRDSTAVVASETGTRIDAPIDNLLFVPTLLKPTFARGGLITVSDLLSVQADKLKTHSGWGQGRIALLVALQKLYRDLATCESSIADFLIASVVDSRLLPHAAIRKMKVREFIDTTADAMQLKGRKRSDFDGLKRLLFSYAVTAEYKRGDNSSYLRGFEHTEMYWRDVPLTVSKRVADFLDRFQLVSLEQLDRLASTAHVTCPESGESLAALEQEQFGDSSLENLRNALANLGRDGLAGYRHGVVCGLEQLPSPDIDWRDIPLRISKRLSEFLDAFRIKSLKDVHSLAIRAQVRCPQTGKVLPALDQKNFSEKSLTTLQRELLLLAELGLDGYRYGKSGKPLTASELVELVLRTLPERDGEVIRLRCTGLTFEDASASFGITRERVRQIEKRAIASSGRFRAAAEGILKPVDQSLLHDCAVELKACLERV